MPASTARESAAHASVYDGARAGRRYGRSDRPIPRLITRFYFSRGTPDRIAAVGSGNCVSCVGGSDRWRRRLVASAVPEPAGCNRQRALERLVPHPSDVHGGRPLDRRAIRWRRLHWSVEPTPVIPPTASGTAGAFTAIACPTRTPCTAVGYRYLTLGPTSPAAASQNDVLIETSG